MSWLLKETPITPNQVSLISFFIALGSLALFINGENLGAGIAAQASSIVDGVDGELARLKNMATKFGAFFDAVLDRYADIAILAGLTYWSITFEQKASEELTVLVGLLAIAGALMVSYSRARAEATLGSTFQGFSGTLATRDVRLFLVMIGAVAGQGLAILALLAILTNGTVLWRLILARGHS